MRPLPSMTPPVRPRRSGGAGMRPLRAVLRPRFQAAAARQGRSQPQPCEAGLGGMPGQARPQRAAARMPIPQKSRKQHLPPVADPCLLLLAGLRACAPAPTAARAYGAGYRRAVLAVCQQMEEACLAPGPGRRGGPVSGGGKGGGSARIPARGLHLGHSLAQHLAATRRHFGLGGGLML